MDLSAAHDMHLQQPRTVRVDSVSMEDTDKIGVALHLSHEDVALV